jgi:drug/metabolite transporter (DMT)-like permease
MACASIAAQINLKLSSGELPVSLKSAEALGFARAAWLIGRAGALSGTALLLTWYTYRHFGFLELFVASSLTYIFAVAASYFVFHEAITWLRLVAVLLVAGGVSLFFIKE